jgi:hypothetical protein
MARLVPPALAAVLLLGGASADAQVAPCQPGGPPFLFRSGARLSTETVAATDIAVFGSGAELAFGRDTFMPDGTVASADVVRLREGASLYSVLANEILASATAVVRDGTGSPLPPPPEPFCALPPVTCGGQSFVIPRQGSLALTPGTYGDVILSHEATLTLAAGDYRFCSLRTGRRVLVTTTGATRSTLHVTTYFQLGIDNVVGPYAGTPPPVLNLGGTSIRLGARARIHASIRAPDARIRPRIQGQLRGCACADGIYTDREIVLIGDVGSP